MATTPDREYAQELLRRLRLDCERMAARLDWAPVVLWMTEEVRKAAASLSIPREVATQMVQAADDARSSVQRSAPRTRRH